MRKSREQNPDLGKAIFTVITSEPKTIEEFFRSSGGAGFDYELINTIETNGEYGAVVRRGAQQAGALAVHLTAALQEPFQHVDNGVVSSKKLTIHDKPPIDPALVDAISKKSQ